MIIPRYWAESRLQNKTPQRQVTVKRWGWSDTSQDDAQALANKRAQEAMTAILAGQNLRRRENLDTYGNQEGVPIREEVVARHGDIFITRNSYGSLCLNTENVFFADVDTVRMPSSRFFPMGCLSFFIVGLIIGFWQRSPLLGAAISIGVPWLWISISSWRTRMKRPALEIQAKQAALDAIRRFVEVHPQWHLRIYETPMGYRLLAMHDLFDPRGESAKAALAALNSDQRFASLCALQACFRARVSPKYWRTGYRPKESLPKTKWPFPPEQLPVRQLWVEGYNTCAEKFASCRFVERVGSQHVHPEAEAVRLLHDRYCRADTALPLA